MKTLVASAVCMFGFAGMCHAGQIASPAIYAGLSQQVAFCIIYNGASTPQVLRVQIFDEAGTVQQVNSSCHGPVSPGGTCSIAKIGISNNAAYACAATAESATPLRGSLILQDGDISLRSEPLQ